MPFGEATPSNDAGLPAEIQQLTDELHRLRARSSANDRATAAQLEALEDRLHALSLRAQAADGGNSLEEAQALLADVRDWSGFVRRLGLEAAATEANVVGQKMAEEIAARWRSVVHELPQGKDPDVWFRALLQAGRLELEAARYEGRSPREAELFAALRDEAREKFRAALAAAPPDAKVRERWVVALLDRGAAVLADMPELDLRAAAARLEVIRREVEWHLATVEAGPGPRRRRLRRLVQRLRAEWQERVVQSRLEARLGRRRVVWIERLLFWLTFVVLGILIVEFSFELDPDVALWLIVADSAICAVFIVEFFTKLSLAPEKGGWFRRHFLIDLLPAIPFGLVGLPEVDPVRFGRLARLLRLSRFVGYLRVLRAPVRIFRVLAFLTRGLDRLARQYAPFLNKNVILYPTPAERRAAWRRLADAPRAAGRLRSEVNAFWQYLVLAASGGAPEEIALARLRPLARALEAALAQLPARLPVAATGVEELPAEVLIHGLSTLTPQEASAILGDDRIAALARVVRIAARPPFRWLPLFRSAAPHVGARTTDAEAVAGLARNIGGMLGQWHRQWFWFSDLYGTITPAQFVDRVGAMLMRWAMRPAYRLTLFGAFFVLTELALRIAHFPFLEPLRRFLYGVLGLPIVVLGAFCALLVGVGFWLQRLAQEATDYYEESAAAQFLHLTEVIRARFLERDARIFYERVIRPERQLEGGRMADPSNMNGSPDSSYHSSAPDPDEDIERFIRMTRAWLVGQHCESGARSAFDAVERTVLLYRDSLDGALLADSDTRTTSQMLGNPALRRFRTWSRRFNQSQEKALQRLALTRQRTLFGGPYLWFFLVTRSVAHLTARLIIHYNQNAVPLQELDRLTEEDRRHFQDWLESRQLVPPPNRMERREDQFAYVVTTAFTALHFLDDDPQRDREVEERFGAAVLARLRRDRGRLIRRVFGTYPLHRLPKAQRVLNLYAAYRSWLGSGRILLLPLFLLGWLVRFLGRLLQWLVWCIDEIRSRRLHYEPDDAADADFFTAVRKIDRMRGPIVRAGIRLRALADPEYLGVGIPGLAAAAAQDDFRADARFLNLEPAFLEEVARERGRAEDDMRRLAALLDGGLLRRVADRLGWPLEAVSTPEHLRAAAVVYLSDYLQVRSLLSADEILREVFGRAALEEPLPARFRLQLRRRLQFRRWWKANGVSGRQTRLAAWRATAHNLHGAADALDVWAAAGAAARERGEQVLADILRTPQRISEALVTLRAVQTLAVLDVLHYREHVFRLGNYAEEDEEWNELLCWGTPQRAETPAS